MNSKYGEEASFFKILSSDSDDFLTLPSDFAEKYLVKGCTNKVQTVVLKPKSGVKWSVNFLKIKEKYYFMDGWVKFLKENLLKIGDLVVFSLLSPPPNSKFQVIFYSPKGCLKQPISSSSGFKKGKVQMPLNRALESAKSFQSVNPFYSVTIKPSYLREWGLYVPNTFLRRYLLRNDEKFVNCVLEVSDGRKWGPVKCRDYKTCGKFYGPNWKKFREDNQLAVGDVCVLELMDEMRKVLKVTISGA